VVTGITLEFQFGTNWSRYSMFVGDIFGSLLAIEATVAFFLESTFLAVWAFGWDRVGKKTHCFAIWMVALASNLSALWIILANGWMQHPVGYVLRNGRAELDDFFAVLANPYAWGQYAHTIVSSWMLAGFFVLGVSAWHLARGSNTDFFRRCLRTAAPFALICALLTGVSGHRQGMIVAEHQPVKLAAMEGVWESGRNVPFHLLQFPNRADRMNSLEWLGLPGITSWLAYGDADAEVKGLKSFPESDWPPINSTFWSFRIMVGLGGLFILLAGAAFWQRDRENICPCLLRCLTWAIPLPYLGLALGWTVSEVGRQPWIVYGLMRTADAVSPVPAADIAVSFTAFCVVYALLGIIDIYLLRKYACLGPGR
jgi:cytochrome d ubiquinol oxidase subunit I